LPGFNARHFQQLVDHAKEMAGIIANIFDNCPLRFFKATPSADEQKLTILDYGCNGLAQIVAHVLKETRLGQIGCFKPC
jgi:hypothetical protein